MKKHELDLEKDEEIVKIIKDIILSRHPILDNRLDLLLKNPRPAMDIHLYCYKDNNKDFTVVGFSDGTEYGRSGIPEEITINGLITFKTIISLINFILSDHDYIKNIYRTENEIILSFTVSLKNENIHGIGCGNIDLRLNFKAYPDHEEILNNYFKVIINNFYEKLKHTENFKKEYNKYCSFIKSEIINSLSEINLRQLINLLSNEDLCNILLNMPNDKFMELYAELKNNQKILLK